MGFRDKDLVNWKASNESVLLRYIKLLLDKLEININGEVSTTDKFYVDVYLKIISEYIELKCVTDLDVKRNLLYRAFFNRLKLYREQTLYLFRKAVAAEARWYLSQPIQKNWVLLPLHVPRNQLGNARPISVLGKKLLFRDWRFLRSRFEFDRFIDETQVQIGDRNFNYFIRFSPILVHAEGRNIREIFDFADKPFNMLRLLINLNFQFGIWTITYGGYPQPIGNVLPPPTYGIFREDGSYARLFYNLTRYDNYQQNRLGNDVMLQVRKLANRLKRTGTNGETQIIIIETLDKYGEALDTFEWRLAFLTLWQILEVIALQSDENINMNKVKNRIILLLKQDPLVRDLLEAIYRTRNSLVHRGSFPDEQGLREVNLLKYIVEISINALFSLSRMCPDKASLLRFYEYASSNETDLTDRERIIRGIRRRRLQY